MIGFFVIIIKLLYVIIMGGGGFFIFGGEGLVIFGLLLFDLFYLVFYVYWVGDLWGVVKWIIGFFLVIWKMCW